MSTIWTLLRATTVLVGSSAALLMGGLVGTAHADPAAPAPAPNIGEQLVTSAANAPQVLQNLGTALGGQPATPPPLASIRVPQPPAAGLPGATSAVPGATSLIPGATNAAPAATTATPGLGIPGLTPTVPATTATPGLGIPGLTPTVPAAAAPAPALAGIPGLTPTVPAAAAPAAGPTGLLPQAQLNLPQMPFLPVPLPQQISLPRDLTSLMTGGVPAAPVRSPGLVPVPAAAPVASPNPLFFPVSGLP
jgi:hypothetical protein